MNLLLDTHVAIWALTEKGRLAPKILDLLADPDNSVHVSAATIWEIAIKFPLKKRSGPPFSAQDAIGYFRQANYVLLSITVEHAAMLDKLPLLHADPFDRLLVAQAMSEPMRLVTRDPQVVAYSDTIITW